MMRKVKYMVLMLSLSVYAINCVNNPQTNINSTLPNKRIDFLRMGIYEATNLTLENKKKLILMMIERINKSEYFFRLDLREGIPRQAQLYPLSINAQSGKILRGITTAQNID